MKLTVSPRSRFSPFSWKVKGRQAEGYCIASSREHRDADDDVTPFPCWFVRVSRPNLHLYPPSCCRAQMKILRALFFCKAWIARVPYLSRGGLVIGQEVAHFAG